MRRLQIGVMGSAADLNYTNDIESIAEEVGRLIAESGNITVYGAEKDYDSLSTVAARGARRVGGMTVGVTYGTGKQVFDDDADVIIATGLERGGGREFVLINSCDAIIVIAGGSGTLTEMAMAYQLNIPIVTIATTGGWAEKLANTFIDGRKRLKCFAAADAAGAVRQALDACRAQSGDSRSPSEF